MSYNPTNPNGQTTSANSSPVVIASDQSAVPVSAASLPLPAGASTEATLALIKAKTDNLDVALSTRTKPADTQGVSGTVTSNIGTTGGLALDATLTGGTTKAINRGGAKGTTAAADITSNPIDANTQAMHVDGSKVTQPVSAASLPLPTGAATETTLGTRLADATFTTRVPVNGQGTMAASIPVTIASNQSSIPVTVTSTTITGTVSENIAQVNGVTVNVGTGVASTGTQRVAVASDSSITANAGTNLNTSLLALESGGNLATLSGTVTAAKVQVSQNAATVPAATTMQNAAVANGNGVSLPVTGYAGAIINIVSSVAMSGGTTINFEASVDDTTWVPISGHQTGTTSIATTTTTDGDFRVATSGYKSIRARISAYSAGTITIKGYVAVNAPKPTTVALGTGANVIGALTANQSVNKAQVNGVTILTGTGATGTGSQRVTVAVDSATVAGSASLPTGSNIVGRVGTDQTTHGTTDLVAADITKIAGTATDVNSRVKSAGTIRVVLATDQPQLTNKLLVTPDSVALPANQSVNVSQINAVTPLMGNGITGTGSQRVTIASDNTAFAVNATLSAETTKVVGVVRNADGSGNLLTSTGAALDVNIKTPATLPVSLATNTPTLQSGSTTAVTQATASNLKAQVAQLASVSSSATLQNAVAVTGNGATLNVDGMSTAVFTVTGTFTATVDFEGTEDGTNYTSLSTVKLGTSTIGVNTTATGVFEAPVAGLQLIRARVTWTSGTSVTVTAHTVPTSFNPKIVNANIVSNTATNQSVNLAQIAGATTATGNGVSGTGVVRVAQVSDGTGVLATVTSLTQMNGQAISMGTGVRAAGTQRVTIATDDVVPVQDNQVIVDNAGFTDGTSKVFMAGYIYDEVAGTALTENDGGAARINVNRSVVHIIEDGVTRGRYGTVTAANAQKVDNSGVTQPVGGETANAATDAGNPVKIGGVGKTANPTAVTDGQRVNATFDKLGKQIVVGAIRDLKGVTQTSVSNTTAETTVIAAVAATFMDVYGLILANTGATTTKVTIKDATAGTTRAIIEVPTLETRGFMLPVDSAIPQATVNNNWTVTCASATTALEVTALWVKNI